MDNFRRNLLVNKKSDGEFVDLGLPSGIKWCNHNIGGTNPEDYGYYFSWGNVYGYEKGSVYNNFSESNYEGTNGHGLNTNIPINNTYDIARKIMGSPWILPSKYLFKELYDNTDNEWVDNYNGTGVAGRKFMKKTDHSVYIFFPACGHYADTLLIGDGTSGYYWSSSYVTLDLADHLYFNNSNVYPLFSDYRYKGFLGRAIQ